jgi:hypothetical protein
VCKWLVTQVVRDANRGEMLMRLTPLALLAVILSVSPAVAQHPYELDPYKPTDAAMLRNYGSVLVGLTPLLELRKLDPYVPSEAALLRQLGGALPLWVGWYPPVPVPAPAAPLTPFAPTATAQPQRPGPNVVVIIVPPRNVLPPSGTFQDRVAPIPGRPRPRVASPQRITGNAAAPKIEVQCDSAECRWRIQNVDPGPDAPVRTECGWMPKGRTLEAGGRIPCDAEAAAP